MPNRSISISMILAVSLTLVMNSFCSGQDNQPSSASQKYIIGQGWARNSVNAVIFRHKSVASYQGTQYVAYYDPQGNMVLARREHGSDNWDKQTTQYRANVKDAHNAISMEVDGRGRLHVSWGMHGDTLNYAQSRKTGGLRLTGKMTMTGHNEAKVTYPQFYRLSNGDLAFIYRHGQSGSGDIMINRYKAEKREWKQLHHPVISGEGERNAYLNTMAVDESGGWHLSWTWRESWDVATNHDIMYAYSPDQGQSWQTSKGQSYSLPITKSNAEMAYAVPQGSELINQTSMTLDSQGRPVIASYWKEKKKGGPQIRIIRNDGSTWHSYQVSRRDSGFSLSGGGTKRIPISRPQIIAGDQQDLYVIYRDLERKGGITVASNTPNGNFRNWNTTDIYHPSTGLWEPTFDVDLWKKQRELHLFGQCVGQGDAEQTEDIEPKNVFIYKWIPEAYRE